jgi:MFS transporter, DHA2 family, multidrug resistance protein
LPPAAHDVDEAPPKAGWVLFGLIAVASVANLNLAVANVALPDIGRAFQASQTSLNLVSVGFSLGLAGTVLYLGAVGDRYGRKMLLVLGMLLTIPTALLATWAPSIAVLIVARVLGGVAAGMAYPTTLALTTALWRGAPRTKAIALWSAIGGSMVAVASVVAGWLLVHFWWGSVFFLSVPLALGALVLAVLFVPSHVNETTEPVDHRGGVLSVVGIIALVLAINFAPTPGERTIALLAGLVALVSLTAFFLVQRRSPHPLFDLGIASRRIFWVAAVAGLIVFGTLMGSIYIGEQFLQNVLGYSTLTAGLAVLPAALAMIVVAPQSAKMIARFGSRITLLCGYASCLISFFLMLWLWDEQATGFEVSLVFVLLGVGVGLAGTPASHSLTGSVPVRRAGMASGTADLQRDLGGAIMQSILGAILTVGYAHAVGVQLVGRDASAMVTSELERSFSSAADVASTASPSQAAAIIQGAKTSFLHGADLAYSAGILFIILGAAVVWFLFPKKSREHQLLESYERQDAVATS